MTTIVRTLEFDAGHRLLKHEGKCRNLHGHRYKVEVEVAALLLDGQGMVTDFSAVKDTVGHWIDLHLDHGYIYQEGDPLVTYLAEHNLKGFAMVAPPTAENIAELLYRVAADLLAKRGQLLSSITVWETPNCRAVFHG